MGGVYLLVIYEADERQGQTLDEGCARLGPGVLSPRQAGSGQPELFSLHGVAHIQ